MQNYPTRYYNGDVADPKDLLPEQMAYYNARAQEYDESVQFTGRFSGPGNPEVAREWHHVVSTLHAQPKVDTALELACGTGLWTKALLTVAKSIVAIDAAREMLEINLSKLHNDRVSYQLVDLFNWHPDESYDLVFFAFWLSHVPTALLSAHLAEVAKAVSPGGRLFIVDEPLNGRQLSGPTQGGQQTRTLHDGSTYRIVKVYLDPDALAAQLRPLGFREVHVWSGDYYFYVNAVKDA